MRAPDRSGPILSGGGFALPDLQATPVFSLSLWERVGVRAPDRSGPILSGGGFALPDLQVTPVFSLSLWERVGVRASDRSGRILSGGACAYPTYTPLRSRRPGKRKRHPAFLYPHPFIHARIPSRNICVAIITRISPIRRSSAFTPFSPSRRRNSDDCSRMINVPPQAISRAITRWLI